MPTAAKLVRPNVPVKQHILISFHRVAEVLEKFCTLASPSFKETNMRYVWEQTVRIVNEMFDDWGNETPNFVDHICALTNDVSPSFFLLPRLM